MKDEVFSSIQRTRSEFEKSFREGEFYNKQTQDIAHKEMIMDVLPMKSGMKILDLGTGSGYLSFPLAEAHADVEIIGLDIVEAALQKNREKAEREGLKNLSFVAYDGIEFPFADSSFDMVITRYALHHFPTIEKTFSEIGRVLKINGRLFVSDPTPNDDDEERFVDAYMQMKKDGHIKFYTKQEWEKLAGEIGLKLEKSFDTSIRFPKKRETAVGFGDILKKHDSTVMKGYDLEVTDSEIYITEKVNNILFQKKSHDTNEITVKRDALAEKQAEDRMN